MTKLDRPPQPDPLPHENFRHGQRNPIHHVPAEDKWRQDGYHQPPEHVEHPEKF
ncbi:MULTISPECIES: hypothetical protein [Rahnella]|uniref:hypothetical protein n=1 Tax=Rahnella TaxID=34037 RepID=UPI003F6E364A